MESYSLESRYASSESQLNLRLDELRVIGALGLYERFLEDFVEAIRVSVFVAIPKP